MNPIEKIDLAEQFARFDDIYVPRIVAELNGQYVKVVKFEGPYPWHQHRDEDEMFLVIAGELTLEVEGQPPTASH